MQQICVVYGLKPCDSDLQGLTIILTVLIKSKVAGIMKVLN